VFLFFIITCIRIYGQNCSEKLKEAENLFNQGELTLVAEKLLPCLQNRDLLELERKEAYKILILSYLYDDKLNEADNTMKEFLSNFPEYKTSASDPEIFKHLYESYQSTHYLDLGIVGGINNTNIRTIQPYSLHYLLKNNYLYESLSGFDIGLSASILVYKDLFFNFEILIDRNRFMKIDTFITYYTINTISITKFSFPICFMYNINTDKLLHPYFKAGVDFEYIFMATFEMHKASLYNSITQYSYNSPIINRIKYYNKYANALILEAGVKYPVPRGNIFGGICYKFGLSGYLNPEKQFTNFEDIFRYRIINDNFSINSFQIFLGWNYLFYKPKKRK
jgi:hypothetical protein